MTRQRSDLDRRPLIHFNLPNACTPFQPYLAPTRLLAFQVNFSPDRKADMTTKADPLLEHGLLQLLLNVSSPEIVPLLGTTQMW